ncbi:Williams-Beuren syndrome chromosomal region 27 protein [Plakobranchus ocellatus]|uniref:Williams-Beuren syndrome chromosomal region 27 protein n=1 Tax=Plakobranchus ocellatus TaxID=259542 RepID=A0AAV4AVZ3_9GAST|nr:Williams-Beuren syndrome chromosomal region 27 protein [Plakobranchus ocellatus]
MQNDESTPKDKWNSYDFIEEHLFNAELSWEESQRRYDQWARDGSYDKILGNQPTVYNAPLAFHDGMIDLFQDKTAVRILDVACGTGLSGQVLHDLGYTNIDGLDASAGSIEIARKKGIYTKFHNCKIGGDTPVPIPDNTYDAACMSGAFAPGHLPLSALPEIIRIIKPGGYFMNCMREEFFTSVPEYANKFLPLLESMVKDGKIRQVAWTIYPHHYLNNDGVRMIYQKL